MVRGSSFVLASRLFREIYDIALLNRTEERGEEKKRGLKRTEGEKGEENNAKEGGGDDGESEAGDEGGNGGEGIEGDSVEWRGGGRKGGRGGLARPLGGHGNYIFMRWFRQMALCRQKKKEEEEEGRGDENRKREGRD